MFKLVDLYIGRTLLGTTALTLSVLVGLGALIKFVEQLRRVGQGDYDMTLAAMYVLLSLPREIEQFMPVATLLGGLIGMGMLAQNSELVVLQASGLSKTDITLSAMKSVVIIMLVMMAIGEFVTPSSEAKAKQLRTEALSGGSLIASDQMVWTKDGDDFVSIGEVIDQNTLQSLKIYTFNDELELTDILIAETASYRSDVWLLENIQKLSFDERQIRNVSIESQIWQSTLTPDKLGVVAIKPEALSIAGLNNYVSYLENNAQDSERYKLAFWRKVLQPLSVAVMLLMALSFIFGPLRSVTMGARTMMGVLTGFGFFATNSLFGPLSLVYQIPPIWGALIPSMLFAGIALFLLHRS